MARNISSKTILADVSLVFICLPSTKNLFKKESIRPVAQLDDLILIKRWQLGVAMQLQSIRACSQKIQKELRFVDISHRHSFNPRKDQNLEEDQHDH